MNFAELFADENEQQLYEKCLEYFQHANEYTLKGLEPPPKEMAQKLKLFIDEYSELVQFIKNGGFEEIVQNRIVNDFNQPGTHFIDNQP